jgi:RIO-like serine/threonine protein kinase
MADSRLLKKDLFGEIWHIVDKDEVRILRDSNAASVWLRWLARRLLQREARILGVLADVDGVPKLLAVERDSLCRSYLPGEPMTVGKPSTSDYYVAAAKLLRHLHKRGVVHNDLAKEPNLLVLDDGSPGFLDFQLARVMRRRGRLFRLLAYDDLRHLLKHKRTYCPQHLTRRELAILAKPSLPSRAWTHTVKPVYLFITRRLLNWADCEGAADRGNLSR